MKWLKSMLSIEGEYSSKRIMGTITIISGLVMGFIGNSQGILFVTAGFATFAVNGITKT